jgi:hypothetical protein
MDVRKTDCPVKINWAINRAYIPRKVNRFKSALVAVRNDVGSIRNMADIIDK